MPPSTPPMASEQLRCNVVGPPYAEIGQKYSDIITWYMVNYRRKEKGYADEPIAN